MRIALISPAQGHRHILDLRYARNIFLGRSASTCVPMALTILDALTPPEFDVTILDEQVDAIDFERPYDVVAITALTPVATRAYQVADAFRARGAWVVMGGLHVTMFPDEAARHADTLCVGEAEGTWPDFLRDYLNRQAQPIYRAYQSVDLATCVIPRWNRLRERRYRFFSIQASRGCRYNCDYCSVRAVFGPTRYKPIPKVLEEIAEVRKHVLPRSDRFLLVDDNLFSDADYARNFMRALIPLRLKWECFAPLNIARDPETLALLRQSGCERLSIGIESISQASLAGVNKGAVNRYDEYKESIARIHDRGISIVGLFMLGFDGDDETIFARTAAFIRETGIAYPVFSIVTPGPSTRLHARLAQEGRILHTRYHWLFREVYGYDALFERTLGLWEHGVLKRPAAELPLRTLLSGILLKELIRQQFDRRDMLPFLHRTLRELWAKPRIDMVSLLLNLGLTEYVNQLPIPARDFQGTAAAPGAEARSPDKPWPP